MIDGSGSGSGSRRSKTYGSFGSGSATPVGDMGNVPNHGSGSGCNQAKVVRKTLIPTVFDFFMEEIHQTFRVKNAPNIFRNK
jgi:hypothetical protein